MTWSFVIVPAMSAMACLVAAQVEAAPRQPKDAGDGSVTAESRYGNPSRTAPVRRGQFGPEVDLGNNTWMHCAADDCRDTLRREKIDFWETKREEGSGGGRE